MNKKKIWVTWEQQRRSVELAEYFGCELFIFTFRGNSLARYFHNMKATWSVIHMQRPTLVFVQNPSIVLAAFAVFLNYFYSYTLVVDRHTNFKFDKRKLPSLKWKLFWCLSNYSLRGADYTIVTNKDLQRIINKIGAKGLVLQDKFPLMQTSLKYPLKDQSSFSALFVCTYAYDEPVDEVVDAFSQLGKDFSLYISGNWKKKWTEREKNQLPDNIIATGFLSEDEYISLMSQVDLVVVFTTNDYTLTCGAYEALSLKKRSLLSDTKTLREYFSSTCDYCDEKSVSSIMSSVKSLASESEEQMQARIDLIEQIEKDWEARALLLKQTIEG